MDVMIFVLLKSLYAFVMIFNYCEACETFRKYFDGFYDDLNRLNWYNYPINIQRMMVIVIATAQKPAEIVGYGNVLCTRNLFKSVICESILIYINIRFELKFQSFGSFSDCKNRILFLHSVSRILMNEFLFCC